MARQPSSVQRVLALFDPLHGCPSTIVETHHGNSDGFNSDSDAWLQIKSTASGGSTRITARPATQSPVKGESLETAGERISTRRGDAETHRGRPRLDVAGRTSSPLQLAAVDSTEAGRVTTESPRIHELQEEGCRQGSRRKRWLQSRAGSSPYVRVRGPLRQSWGLVFGRDRPENAFRVCER